MLPAATFTVYSISAGWTSVGITIWEFISSAMRLLPCIQLIRHAISAGTDS